MTFIKTPDPAIAAGATAEMYSAAEASYGYLPNMHRVFGHRPQVMTAWSGLLGAIRGQMSLRRYELVALAAAKELKSTYCMLAHALVLKREGMSEAELAAIALEEPAAAVDDTERAVMAIAGQVVRDASSVTQNDIDRLLAHGLGDAEIFYIVATAAATCLFSKVLDALGGTADPVYRETFGDELFKSVVVGREPQSAG